MHKVPNLYRNRLGTYYLRITVQGREVKRSLGTKDRPKAVRSALLFALARDEGLRFDTTTPMHRTEPMPQGEQMKNIPSVLRKGRGASDIDQIDRSKAADGTDSSAQAVPDIDLPDDIKKLDVLVEPSGIVRLANVNSNEDEARALRMAQALRAGDMYTAIAMAAPSVGAPIHLQPISAMAGIGAASRTAHTSKPFKEVQDLYLVEMKRHNSPKTCSDKASTYADFVGVVGSVQIDEVDATKAQTFKQKLLASDLSAIRINTKISHLSELLDWAVNNHHMHAPNPFKTMRVSSKKKIEESKENYEPFSQKELASIFSDQSYSPFMCEADYYWLPWMGLHTGARIEELASLDLSNIKEEEGVFYFDIRKGKNSNSIRRVPIHENLLKAGFLGYVAAQKAKKATLLFPHLIAGKNGYSKNMSRRFGQYLDKLEIKSAQKVFHSFRSTFITKMTEANVHPAMLMALVGHYDQAKVDLSAPHFQNYQGSKLLSALKQTMDVFNPGPISLPPPPPSFRSDLKPKKIASKKTATQKAKI